MMNKIGTVVSMKSKMEMKRAWEELGMSDFFFFFLSERKVPV